MSEFRMNVDDGGGRQRSVPVDLPSNSRTKKAKAQAPQKKVTSVVSSEVTKRKPSLWRRATGSFVNDDYDSVLQFVVMEVLVPAAKNMISDATKGAVDGYLFGNTRVTSRNDRPGSFNYRGVQRQRTETAYGVISPRARTTHDFDDLIFASRGEAEDVLDGLRLLLDQYEVVSVRDFYDLAGMTAEFVDEKWGWHDLRDAHVRPVRGGYTVSLPRTQPISQ